MLLTTFKNKFLDSLKEEYPSQEVNSFFFLLTEAFFNVKRLDIALDPSKEITAAEVFKMESALERLKMHEPIQYIIGETEFFGLKFKVNDHVLIPRPETEELVQWILDDTQKSSSELKILDIGTGTGCIPVSLAHNIPRARIYALDVSAKALETARQNAEINSVKITFMEANILQQKELDEIYDVIVSNPPYVRELEKKEMHRNVLEHEPELALYVKDEDPLLFYRKITKLAKAGLAPNGRLYFEINQYLAAETEELLKAEGFKTQLRKDIFGNYRMLKGNL